MDIGCIAKDSLAYIRVQQEAPGEKASSQDLVAQLGEEAYDPHKVATSIFDFLWLDESMPETMAALGTKISNASAEIDRLCDLTTRVGAEMALTLMLIWYKDAQVEKLVGGFRVGSDHAAMRLAHSGLCAAKIKIASYADVNEGLTVLEAGVEP